MLGKFKYGSIRYALLLPSALFLLMACERIPQEAASKPIVALEVPKGISLEPRYKATLSEGISFSRPGYPDFISSVQGMSVADSTIGRWTDGAQTLFEFVKPLPEKFNLEISAGAASYWQDKPISVTVGSTKFESNFGVSGSWTAPSVVSFPVTTDGKTKTIAFDFPGAKSPNELGFGEEGRKIALFLHSIKIN